MPLVVAGERAAAAATLAALMDLVASPDQRAGGDRAAPMAIEKLARRDQATDPADPADAVDGQALAATVAAGSLEELFRILAARPPGLTEDEIRRLGIVLVQRIVQPGQRLRVVAAHYLRPLERDGQGHLQRRPPAVLATWDAASDTFEHFAWGVTPELGFRVGRSQADLERRQVRRATFLHGLVHAGTSEPVALDAALRRYALEEQLERPTSTDGTHPDHHDHHHGGQAPQA